MKKAMNTTTEQSRSHPHPQTPRGRYFEDGVVIPDWLKKKEKTPQQSHKPETPPQSEGGP